MKKKGSRRSSPPARSRPVRAAVLPAALARARSLGPPVGFLLACLLPAILPVDWFHSRLWKGYYAVFLPSETALSARGSLVSRQAATVRFNTFAGMAGVRVAELPSRLDPADPRLDPFLRGVDRYFRAPGGEWVYARSNRGPLFAGLGRLGRGRQVLELDPAAALIRLLLLAGASLLILLPARVPHVPRWLLGLGLLPWALVVPTGDLRNLLAFLLLYPVWIRLMVWAAGRQPGASGAARSRGRSAPAAKSRGQRGRAAGRRGKAWRAASAGSRQARLRAALSGIEPAGAAMKRAVKSLAAAAASLAARSGGPGGARRRGSSAAVPWVLALLGAAVFFLAAPGAGHLPGALFALAADLCLLAMVPTARRWERSRRAHPLFRALPILGTLKTGASRRRQRLSTSALLVPAALALLALVSAGALSLEARRRELRPPRLEPSSSRGLTWESLGSLPLSSDPQAPPHLGDFLAHRAFQESLAFQRPYRFPAPGERIYISGYAVSGTRYVQSRRVALRFSESWLPRCLAAAPPGSVERLLVDQGRAAAVRRVAEPELLRELAPWPRAAAVALFLLACLTAAIRSDTRTFAL